jgi:hypothetical protein
MDDLRHECLAEKKINRWVEQPKYENAASANVLFLIGNNGVTFLKVICLIVTVVLAPLQLRLLNY